LRLEISCESDKKKMNLIFNYSKKIFLTGKMKEGRRRKTKTVCQKNLAQPKPLRFKIAALQQTSSLIVCASRVDRIGLGAQFSASAGEGQTLS
jgi:hypothetical protein